MASRDALGRHRSLEAAIAWSYRLLAPSEQAVFRRLAIFPGSFTIEAMESICDDGADVAPKTLEGFSTLVEHNLVHSDHSGSEQRFRMLETIREFAHDCLARDADLAAVQTRHSDYYLSLVEAAEPQLWGQGERVWLDRLDAEEANLRSALERRGATDIDYGLRLTAGLWRYWELSGRLTEGRARIESLLGRVEAQKLVPSPHYAAALLGAGYLARDQSDLVCASARFEQSLAVAKAAGDQKAIGSAQRALAILAQSRGSSDVARELFEAALDCFRRIDHNLGVGWVLRNLGILSQARGDYDNAARLFHESLLLLEEIGDEPGSARSIGNLGILARIQGQYSEAEDLLSGSLARLEHASDQRGICLALCALALLSILKGEQKLAGTRLERCLRLAKQIGDANCEARSLAIIGAAQVRSGEPAAGIALIANAMGRLRQLDEDEQALLSSAQTEARAKLGGAGYKMVWQKGISTGAADAIAMALDACIRFGVSAIDATEPPPGKPLRLSSREREVLQEIAAGKTNREIADQLVLSEYTVMRHVSNILRKLDAPSRAAAVSIAGAAGLLSWPTTVANG
jgi:ATP/maltotriose-dependent transcriptional regulator MalT